MGIFSVFHRKLNPDKLGEQLGKIITLVSAEECTHLQELWSIQLSDRRQVLLFVKYCIMLANIADRLAYEKLGDPARVELMSAVVNQLSEAFCRQSNFGRTDRERGLFFANAFHDLSEKLASCDSIMGRENQIVLHMATHLVSDFIPKVPASQQPNIVLQTAKSISTAVVSIFATPSFKAIS